VLIGGGNSAGQATVFLANFARSIRVLIRGADLHASMSKYLVDRIGSLPNVSVCTRCTLQALDGDETGLTHVRVRREGEADEVVETRHLFLFIGADPKTDWLASSGVELDSRGFVVTGALLRSAGQTGMIHAFPLQTSLYGMFAVGDVRAESTKRVASAVGDGAAVVSQIHAYLSQATATAQNV
jgi:thioredoxin reductase (NADPH)